MCVCTLILVATQHDDDLVPADTDELVDRTNTTARELRQQDHALDVVVLEQRHIGAHLGDAAHVHHDEIIDLRVLLLVVPTLERSLLLLGHYDLSSNDDDLAASQTVCVYVCVGGWESASERARAAYE